MTDFSHLDTLQGRLARENDRLANATTDRERSFRVREITACKKEIAAEYKFLGIEPVSIDDILSDPLISMSDDELLAALTDAG